jgi:ParB/RepB/Spo0J family partition protein
MIQDIPIDLIKGQQNNRSVFTGISDLADSIMAHGLLQPITVKPDPAGDGYILLAGERRYRAHVHANLKTIAADIRQVSSSEGYLITLLENDNRQATNDIDKAVGYDRAINEFSMTKQELSKAIGKRLDYIDRRLALLHLRSDLQKLVADRQLPITYAGAMVELDHDRQLIASKALNENPAPTIAWFARICGALLDQQNQIGFDFGMFGAPEDALPEALQVSLPDDPSDYRPSFNGAAMLDDLARQVDQWTIARDGWRELGKTNKVDQCQTIIDMLDAMARAMPAAMPATSPADRIWRLLADNGPMTTREIYQYGNIDRAQWHAIRAQLSDRISEARAGRGYRYTAITQ